MIKNRFPKRKNGSVDGVSSVLPEYYQLELNNIAKEHAKELGQVNKKLDESQNKLSEECKRNGLLERNLLEQTNEISELQRIVMSQEETIKNLTIKSYEYEENYMKLKQTLTESEELNKDMTNKLKQYSDERSRLAFEKETLSAENKQITNRLEMEKRKNELWKQKNKSDNTDVLQQNDILRKQVERLKQGLDGQIEISETANTSTLLETNQIENSELNDNQRKCIALEKDLLSTGQSLDQLEKMLHKKSAESSALSISMNTLQMKFDNVKAENEVLKERINHLGKEENKLSQEIELRKNTQLENMKMSTDFNSMKNEHSRLSKLNKEINLILSQLKDENHLQELKLRESELKIASLEKKHSSLHNENETWKANYERIRRKLLDTEYQKSDAAKVDLEHENNSLKIYIDNLKSSFTKMTEEMDAETKHFQQNHEQSLIHLKLEKRKLERCINSLKTSLEMTNARLTQSERLSELKEKRNKKLHEQFSDVSSKLLFLEESLRGKEREIRDRDEKITLIKFQRHEIQIKNVENRFPKDNRLENDGLSKNTEEDENWFYNANKIYFTKTPQSNETQGRGKQKH